MNRIISISAMCLAAIAAFAQEKADIEVSYSASYPSFKTGKIDRYNQFNLIANSNVSKFYSPMTEYIDSLESTPEGKENYRQVRRNAFMGGKMDQVPRRDGRYYVLKSAKENAMSTYDVNGLDKYRIDESFPDWEWQIADSSKNVLGYECQMATTTFHGRGWTVWFTPEIPVANGPWKLGGLPGLILEAADNEGLYTFVVTGIQQSANDIIPVYSSESYERIDRKDLLRLKRKMNDSPIAEMNAQLNGLGISLGGDANAVQFKSREEIDFIETDY